jgi:hypothetical protein
VPGALNLIEPRYLLEKLPMEPSSTEGWREMTKCDVPSRPFFAKETVSLMERGESNSNRIRNRIRTDLNSCG